MTAAKTGKRIAPDQTRVMAERSHLKYSPLVVAAEAEIAELKEQISTLRVQLAAYPKKETRMNDLLLTERLAGQSYEFFF